MKEISELEVRYAIMLDESSTMLSVKGYELVQKIIELIEKTQLFIEQADSLINKEADSLQDFYNSRYIFIMENYINNYKLGLINQKKLKNNVEALVNAIRDFLSEMAVLAVSQMWGNAVVAEICKIETIYKAIASKNRNYALVGEQVLIDQCLDNVGFLIAEYKTNFRECLRNR